MRTMLFSPMWLDGPHRLERHIKWEAYYSKMLDLKFDAMFFVDNASVQTINSKAFIYRCETHLPRITQYAYGYWYRAFRIAVEHAIANHFEKILHIDTDAYLLKPNICQYIDEVKLGWVALWSEMYGFPETAIQVICKDQFQRALDFFTDGFLEKYPYEPAENLIPFTHIEKSFRGDRYGELIKNGKRAEQTEDMDYYCQANPETELIYNRGK